MLKCQINKKKLNTSKLYRLIGKYKIISFDIFDTLIKRDVFAPSQIFELIEKNEKIDQKSLEGFKKNRILAESTCRNRTSHEEITLIEIYEELQKYYSKEVCEYLLQYELQYEVELCHSNPVVKPIFDWCLSNGKTVVLTTDMYLPHEVIKKILKNCGCSKYEKLYLSCEIGKTKLSGNLFQHLLKDLSISNKEIIHVGDNIKSDYFVPLKLGIKAYHINTNMHLNFLYNDTYMLNPIYKSDYNNIVSFIGNRLSVNRNSVMPYLKGIGYETEGPLLYGFLLWLNYQLHEKKVEKLFFLSRDGAIMLKAWKEIEHLDIDCSYMYASRRSYIVPTLWKCQTLQDMIQKMFVPRIDTLSSFLKRVGLDPENYREIVTYYGLELDKEYNWNVLVNNKVFLSFFDSIKENIYHVSKREFNAIVNYLHKKKFCGTVAIVDIGWHGNMQVALQEICEEAGIKASITGYYVGLNPNSINISEGKINAKGFICQPGKNEYYFESLRTFISVFEIMFTAGHGTVINFTNHDNSTIIPCLDNFEYDVTDGKETFSQIKAIQDGAIQYIKDVSKYYCFRRLHSAQAVFQNFLLMGNAPDYKMAKFLGDLKFYDNTLKYVARPSRPLSYYMFHLIKLKKDLCNSTWNIGFFKRLFKLNFPFYECYITLRKIYLKIKWF